MESEEVINKEKRALIAERVMGWHLRDSDMMWPDWLDSNDNIVYESIDWNPDLDIEQAMEVVDAIGELPFSNRYHFYEAMVSQAGVVAPYWWFLFVANKPKAIFDAAVVVAEKMVGNDIIEPIRASGECICPVCNKEYRRHPDDTEILGYDGQPFLRVLCDGTRVKL